MNTHAWMIETLEMIVAQEGQLSTEDWAEVLLCLEEAKKENNMTLADYRDKVTYPYKSALRHCVVALAEYERKPGEELRPLLMGALDTARGALRE